jgi:primosomal protein N' (replication factor Y)
VGVINADTMLKLPDFRASERTFDLLSQVAGRCGRAELPGKVIVQTYCPSDTAIQAAAHYDRERFLGRELALREGLGYPPFVRLANVLVWGKDQRQVAEVGRELFASLSEAVRRAGERDWSIFPATPCVLSRLSGTYRYHLLIKVPVEHGERLGEVLEPFFRSRKPTPGVNVSVDVDPVSLL